MELPKYVFCSRKIFNPTLTIEMSQEHDKWYHIYPQNGKTTWSETINHISTHIGDYSLHAGKIRHGHFVFIVTVENNTNDGVCVRQQVEITRRSWK